MKTVRPVVVMDFGAQYAQLIARRVREQHIYSVIVPCNLPFEELKKIEPLALILSGGPASVYDAGSPTCDDRVFQMGLPVLGICYGLHIMSSKLGGKVERAERREYGFARLDFSPHSQLLCGLTSPLRVWNSHGDHVTAVPPGFEVTGRTENAIAVIENPETRMYAVEFHPEVRHTDRGDEILKRCVLEVAKIQPNWFPKSFIEETVERVR